MSAKETNSGIEGFSASICPLTNARIQSSPEWTDISLTKEYSASFELINDNTIRVFPKGRSTFKGITEIFKKYDEFLKKVGLNDKPYIEVSDYAGINNIPSQRTRLKVMETILEKAEKKKLAGHFIYNVPMHIKWMFNIGIRFYRPSIPMHAYDTFGQAYKASLNVFSPLKAESGTFSFFKKMSKKSRHEAELEKYSTEILKYIGAINWKREEYLFERLDDAHPFSAVFDSLKILKTDLDENLKERRKIEKIYKNLFNHIVDPIIVFDKRTHQIYDCNHAFLNIYGYTRDEIRTMTPEMLHPEEERERAKTNIDNKYRPEANQYTHFTKLGEKIDVEVRTDETEYKGHEAWVSTFLDITERNLMEKELRQHQDELEKLVEERTRELEEEIMERKQAQEQLEKAKTDAEKATKAKSEFLANMSHEIRTPMNGIMGMVELIQDTRLENHQKNLISTINMEAESLLSIINSVLDFSKIEAGKLELDNIPFNLRFLFEDLSVAFAVTAQKKNIELISFLPPDAPEKLIGDPGRVRQIFVNLIGNALKFTQTGEIFIWADKFKEMGDKIQIKFCIKDTGIGIPKEKQDKIFDSFSQADGSTTRKYGGTGLGTTISKQLVSMMGGDIGFESTPQKGTTFWFTAVFQKDDTVPENTHYRTDPSAGLEGLQILIVDDNQNNLLVLSEHLKSWGCEPFEAGSGPEAIDILTCNDWQQKSFDMIICDFQMPQMNGFELVETIRKNKALGHVPIVILTSMGMVGDNKTCRELGIKGYLTKPVKQNDLKTAIISILQNSDSLNSFSENSVLTKHRVLETQLEKPQILLAEDYFTNQMIVSQHLNKNGYQVTPAEDGQKAVKLFKKKKFDLVLMDIQMPVMDGYEACRQIRLQEAALNQFMAKKDPTHTKKIAPTPIIAMTAHALKGYKEKCLEAGMNDYITKPFKKKDLLALIEKWIYKKIKAVESGDGDTLKETTKGAEKKLPVDLKKAFFEFENDEEFFFKILKNFIKTADTQVPKIRQGIQDKDFKTIKEQAHSIKGGSASLTAMAVSTAARKLEVSAEEEDISAVQEHSQEMENALSELKDYVQTL